MAGQSVGHDSWPRSGPRLREGGEVTSVSLAGVLTLELSQLRTAKQETQTLMLTQNPARLDTHRPARLF